MGLLRHSSPTCMVNEILSCAAGGVPSQGQVRRREPSAPSACARVVRHRVATVAGVHVEGEKLAERSWPSLHVELMRLESAFCNRLSRSSPSHMAGGSEAMPEKSWSRGFRQPTHSSVAQLGMAHHWRRRPFGLQRLVRMERLFGSHRAPFLERLFCTCRVSRAAAFLLLPLPVGQGKLSRMFKSPVFRPSERTCRLSGFRSCRGRFRSS